MEFYAHSLEDRPKSEWERLADHLDKVGSTAATFANAFDARSWGDLIGRSHDLGKMSSEFQSYIQGPQSDGMDAGAEDETPSGKRVDHSTFGARVVAQLVEKPWGQLLAFCIAGHHTGLPDESSGDDAAQRGTLRYRLDSSAYSIPPIAPPALTPPRLAFPLTLNRSDTPFQLAFFTRMLFSCLIDADRTCTEAFCDPQAAAERTRFISELGRPTLRMLKDRLNEHLKGKQSEAVPSEVNRQRAAVLASCLTAGELPPGFFSLNVPTGGGKTLSSLAFALTHATLEEHGLRRIVVAIPFTSIIEQTADVYRTALGDLAGHALVEHHTNLHPTRNTRANQLGAENWDAPLIVTTNVQLFESLFDHRTTPCRKLHNLARSVIILDEAQTIPVELLKPALAAMRELVLNYGCSIVLCTATQPALERRPDFPLGLENVRPIIPDSIPLFHALRRVEVVRLPGKLSDDELAARLVEEKRVLCIVNSRKHASRLFEKVASGADAGNCFHLSTWMCGEHRRSVLKTIRDRLNSESPTECRVVSTQLVEAGVDLDFPKVYRAEAGFDSIAQAAGRCNREGKLPLGFTYVFEGEERPPAGLLRDAADTAKELAAQHSDPLDPQSVEAYFRLFYWTKKESWDKRGVMKTMAFDRARGRALFQFREMSAAFRMIEDDQLPLLIPYGAKGRGFWDSLAADKIPFVPQRELQPYLVSVTRRAMQEMEKLRFVKQHESGVWLLLNRSLYSPTKGLDPASTRLDESYWSV
jgi:CRISPR-associated endonuclease/helicase Cas3